ncbi:ubquitin-like protein, putative [Bodo saltans]|uniref:Ubquitin-like protein, putative n=1 Tax=Bodo saltans TaxID=75058 RepID=A0A0S4IPP0_BODSA|nr:ubquitin-like protein, putative [Bodo saltans]|eukprot:CUE71475.1 ubquitin-like protein, putative [Bodo saltans]
MPTTPSDENCSVTVLSSIDGKHYKMVMKGDVGQLSVSKVKRYLQHATGIDPKDQRLTYEQRLLFDHEIGIDFGLHDGAVIILGHLQRTTGSASDRTAAPGAVSSSFRASPQRDDAQTLWELQNQREIQQLWFDKELHRVREEEREKFEHEKRVREDNEQHRELERTRVMERNRLMEQDFRDMETRYKIECEKLRLQLSREERVTQELREKIQLLEEDRVCEAERNKEERRRIEADASRKDKERQVSDDEMERLVVRLHREIDTLRLEYTELERKYRAHHQSGFEHSPKNRSAVRDQSPQPRATAPLVTTPARASPSDTLVSNLQSLSSELNIAPLTLDSNNTCIVSVDQVNLILTFDPNTERLFLYTTLLNNLPAEPSVRLQLYEELLQGALLGREIAGGCVGVSKSPNRLILLSTAFDLKHIDGSALRAVVRPFIAATKKWVEHVRSVCAGEVPRAQSISK